LFDVTMPLSALGYNMGIRKDSTECDIPSK
jgi:hypothetical protein